MLLSMGSVVVQAGGIDRGYKIGENQGLDHVGKIC